MDAIEYFWSLVDVRGEDDCWEWKAARSSLDDARPYGYFRVCGIDVYAHRFSFWLAGGKLGRRNMVRHTCDNTRCVNPRHLKAGTHTENMRDRQARSRQARGESHGKARLTEDQVREIKREYREGATATSVAGRYGISQSQASRIRSGERWGHVEEKVGGRACPDPPP